MTITRSFSCFQALHAHASSATSDLDVQEVAKIQSKETDRNCISMTFRVVQDVNIAIKIDNGKAKPGKTSKIWLKSFDARL